MYNEQQEIPKKPSWVAVVVKTAKSVANKAVTVFGVKKDNNDRRIEPDPRIEALTRKIDGATSPHRVAEAIRDIENLINDPSIDPAIRTQLESIKLDAERKEQEIDTKIEQAHSQQNTLTAEAKEEAKKEAELKSAIESSINSFNDFKTQSNAFCEQLDKQNKQIDAVFNQKPITSAALSAIQIDLEEEKKKIDEGNKAFQNSINLLDKVDQQLTASLKNTTDPAKIKQLRTKQQEIHHLREEQEKEYQKHAQKEKQLTQQRYDKLAEGAKNGVFANKETQQQAEKLASDAQKSLDNLHAFQSGYGKGMDAVTKNLEESSIKDTQPGKNAVQKEQAAAAAKSADGKERRMYTQEEVNANAARRRALLTQRAASVAVELNNANTRSRAQSASKQKPSKPDLSR